MEVPKETCPKCNGKGAILHNDLEYADYVCEWCGGDGEVDWIEMVMGKKSIHRRDFDNYYKRIWQEEEMLKFDFPFEHNGKIITLK